MTSSPHVVIIGGGFGGLRAARGLASAPVRITLIDKSNHHLFQPLLYQVATAGLSAPSIAAPIRHILARQRNLTVLLDEVVAIDAAAHSVQCAAGGALAYDYLVVASGATHSYFGHDEWAAFAPGLKTLADAFEIRKRILLAFEYAERAGDEEARRRWLTFAVIGAGATGVEMAGTLAEIAHQTLPTEFRRIDPRARRAWCCWKGRSACCRPMRPIFRRKHVISWCAWASKYAPARASPALMRTASRWRAPRSCVPAL